jgi:chorismate mutase
VQALADTLKGSDVPVLIKNPVNTDLKLWIGAVERLQKAGVKTLGLIHRGFSQYGCSEYRNAPVWQIPIEMKRHFPDLPMLCDPSHICGGTEKLLSISQKSIDLDYCGLMIEAHYNPEIALTDKAQQLKPADLNSLLKNIEWKKNTNETKNYLQQLDALRDQINYIDDELISLISNRMKVSVEIGQLKKQNQVTVLQPNRYNEIIDKCTKIGQEKGLSSDFIHMYIEAIHMESIRLQNSLAAN